MGNFVREHYQSFTLRAVHETSKVRQIEGLIMFAGFLGYFLAFTSIVLFRVALGITLLVALARCWVGSRHRFYWNRVIFHETVKYSWNSYVAIGFFAFLQSYIVLLVFAIPIMLNCSS